MKTMITYNRLFRPLCNITVCTIIFATAAMATTGFTIKERQEVVDCLALFDGIYFHHSDVLIYEQLPPDPVVEKIFSDMIKGLTDTQQQALSERRSQTRFQTLSDLKAAENRGINVEGFIKRIQNCEAMIQPLQ